MWVWKAGTDSQHPNPKTNSPFLGSHELLINPQLEVALRSFPSFHAGSFNWLDLVKSSVQVLWCPVQKASISQPCSHPDCEILSTLQHSSLNLEDTELQQVLLTTQSLTLSTFNSYVYLHQGSGVIHTLSCLYCTIVPATQCCSMQDPILGKTSC